MDEMCRFMILLIYNVMAVTLLQDRLFCFSHAKQRETNKMGTKDLLGFDKLISAIETNPFKIWYFKDSFKSLEDLLLTPELLVSEAVERKTTRNRLQNVMTRALLGQDIGVAIMGGSISAGGGLINDYPDLRGIYYRVFIDWWEKAVQLFTNSKIRLHNLAVGGTCSNFYSFCYKTLLKPQETTDIIFLEFSVNDYVCFKNSQFPKALSLEKLTRSVLSEQSSPAVMYINFIQGVQSIAQCNRLENNGGTMLAWHYGITSISIRSSLCPNPENRKTPLMFSSDGNHASLIAHAQMAIMIINTARDALMGAIRGAKRDINANIPSHDLPRNVFYSMGTTEGVPDPLCYTLITPDVHQKVLNPSFFVKAAESIGFKPFEKEAIGFRKTPLGQNISGPLRTDGFGGWLAKKENSTLKLQLFLPQDNVTRSVAVVFRTYGYGGKAEIWLDNNKPGVVISFMSPFGYTRLVTIAKHVTSGSHVLNVRTVKAGKVMLCGITAEASFV